MSVSSKVRSCRSLSTVLIFFLSLWGLLWYLGAPATAATTGQLTASWNDDTPNDHDGFKIERKTGTAGTYAQISTAGATTFVYVDATVLVGTNYCYRVRAYNTAGDSAYTPEACQTVAAPTPPAATTYTLSVSKSGTGTGTVGSAPAGISCGSTCSGSFFSGTSVTLTAAPATGSTFSGWSGACAGTGLCTVTMSQARAVAATFTAVTQVSSNIYTLSVSKGWNGTGTVGSAPAGISCGSACSASFAGGTTVSLTAIPAIGSTFTGWSGACTGTGDCSVTMSQSQSVTANFRKTRGKQ